MLIQSLQKAVERELRAKGLPLDPPTYTVTTATGDVETHVHDEASISTEEEKVAWAAYKAAQEQLTNETNERVSRAMLSLGVVVDDPPDGWADDMRYLGLEVPEDPRELRSFYLEMEILKTPADLMNAIIAITRLSADGMPQEALESAEALFRRSLEGNSPATGVSKEG